ncbi:DUF2267 domain-containing protein [Amycolatopsis sp. FBCC-B4732]|uniref:DUF2267 domain-containing protein n=1 Tax=Amycolatopsis sp. FBCC-B4732 TaxID=3079339 RepID=UPI001FF31BA4|nr:DUF2267 domain-containing protein [Amycolatopsis sp. FBCC-B4732]UOX90615.1 DUF2267 domain-containing protein [Amycolatopsis sp. FBCC-B4732]
MRHPGVPFAGAAEIAAEWLAAVGERLGTDDRAVAYRMLRAWLHTVRDRLTVESAARFAASLPDLLRGLFYESWTPHHVPTRYHVPGFVARFAGSADTTRAEVPAAAAAVTAALEELCPPGRLEDVFRALPDSLTALLTGHAEVPRAW